jgi:hypothetical protein
VIYIIYTQNTHRVLGMCACAHVGHSVFTITLVGTKLVRLVKASYTSHTVLTCVRFAITSIILLEHKSLDSFLDIQFYLIHFFFFFCLL